jgi:hypothetical protein
VETERREKEEAGGEKEGKRQRRSTKGKRQKERDSKERQKIQGGRRIEKRGYIEEKQWRAKEWRNRSTEGRDKGSDRGKRQREETVTETAGKRQRVRERGER